LENIHDLTTAQLKAIKSALNHNVTLIQGPPGCGKTYTIGAIIISLLKYRPNERILICGETNQSLRSLITVVSNNIV